MSAASSATAGAEPRAPGWGRVLAIWLVIGACVWFFASFARRDGGALDADTLYDAWFGARPAGLVVDAARRTSSGSNVLQMHGDGATTARLPSRWTLVTFPDPGGVLAVFRGFDRYEQKLPGDAAAPSGARSSDGGGDESGADGPAGGPSFGGGDSWREIERGDLSFGAWTSTYVRLRKVAKDQPDRDQVRINVSDKRRYAVLLGEWEPGVESKLQPLEPFLAELALRVEVADPLPAAR